MEKEISVFENIKKNNVYLFTVWEQHGWRGLKE